MSNREDVCCSHGFLKMVSFSMFTNDLEGEVNLILIRLTNVKKQLIKNSEEDSSLLLNESEGSFNIRKTKMLQNC